MRFIFIGFLLIGMFFKTSIASDNPDTLFCKLMDEEYNIYYEIDYESRLIEGDELGNIAGLEYFASSFLSSIDTNSYSPKMMGDRKKSTAWVEGVKGYGIGECFNIKIKFPKYIKDRRLSSIEFLNGYCKSENIWKANSRIKRLKITLDKEVLFVVEISDSNWPQIVRIPKEKNIKIKNGDIISFEIIDVYHGTKYKDTALSEIVFNVPL